MEPLASSMPASPNFEGLHVTPHHDKLALYDFATASPSPRRILVLKLDHLGDFLIGLPALAKLRTTFPRAYIVLICGPWNVATARALGVADEVRAYEYFPENAQGWDGLPVEDLDRFRGVCSDRFDLALDLRVDEDTRPLLRHVDTGVRCGIGYRSRHPFLDIVLPGQFESRERRHLKNEPLLFSPSAFHSRMPIRSPFFHATDFSVTDSHLIYGPYARLPSGKLRAEFSIELIASLLSARNVEVAVEVARVGEDRIAFKRKKSLSTRKVTTLALEFSNDDPAARFEFRVFIGGHPRRPTQLRFYGVRVEGMEAEKQQIEARFLTAELHIGEQLSLPVDLIAQRIRPLYGPDLPDRLAASSSVVIPKPPGISGSGKCIVIAPFSNSNVRDWPLEYYGELISLLLSVEDLYIVLLASASQASRLAKVAQGFVGNNRLVNLAGQTNWTDLVGVLRQADLVIANNSGIAHLAAACARPTLAIYSGSHQPREWGPRGRMARALTASISCSPCGYDDLQLCPNDHRCMTSIKPEDVAQYARAMLASRDMARSLGAPVD